MSKFSVSMCTYDGDSVEYLREALESVLRQTRSPDEIVIVIDGPVRKELDDLLNDFSTAHSLIRLVRLKTNVGHGEARRTGLEECSHEIVALMDADDICLQDRFEKQLARFEANPDLAVSGGSIEEFQIIDGIYQAHSVRELPENDSEIKSMLKWRCPVNQPTVMLRKSIVQEAGGYIDWFCNEDYFLWVRMALNGAVFENVPDVVLRFRIDEDTYRRRGGWRYFSSEAKLQYFIFRNGLSNPLILVWNTAIRFGVQVLCPPALRKYLYTRVFRRDAVSNEARTNS